jgi:6-phosphogluconolactonase (cycloisomerase 2 family)
MYYQMEDGTLKGPVGRYETGGYGTNFGSSADAIIVYEDYVFIANGENNAFSPDPQARGVGSVSAFKFTEFGALRTDVQPSGGDTPVTLALYDGTYGKILYCGNAAFQNNLLIQPLLQTAASPTISGSITALYVEEGGSLTPMPGLTQVLGVEARLVDIKISPDSKYLLAAVSGFNEVRAYELDEDGMLTGEYSVGDDPNSIRPVGVLPVEIKGKTYVYSANAESQSQVPFAGSVSAFRLEEGKLELINNIFLSAGLPAPEAPSWFAVYENKYLYVVKPMIYQIGSFEIDQDDGSLKVLEEVAANTGGVPLDYVTGGAGASAAVFNAGTFPIDAIIHENYLYVLSGGTGEVKVYLIGDKGELTLYQTFEAGLPANTFPFINGGWKRGAAGMARGQF